MFILIITFLVINFDLGKASKKKGTNLEHCPKFGYPHPPPSQLGTSLSEILLTVFLKYDELGMTDQLAQFWCQNT